MKVSVEKYWIPAFAGMTGKPVPDRFRKGAGIYPCEACSCGGRRRE